MNLSPQLLWLDLETTGLDPRNDHILEVAMRVARLDRPLEWHQGYVARMTLPEVELTPFIRDMHTKNGLLAECAESALTCAAVEHDLFNLIGVESEKAILAGNSVHFDLGFIRHHMPHFASRLPHRVFDVTAISMFCQSLGMPKPAKAEAHRARADVAESMEIVRQCSEWTCRR